MSVSYVDLVAAIIRSGLKYEGPNYLRTRGGQYWCFMSNLDPEAVRKLAIEHSPQEQRLSAPETPAGQEAMLAFSKNPYLR